MIRLLDSEWERIRKHFPEENIADGRPGRKPVPTRLVLEAVLWILNTGAQWHMLPQGYPNYKTVHRRFQTWCRNEILRRVLTDIANELRDRGALDEEECFIDATFAMAKGGGAQIGATKRGKGLKIMAIVDRHGLPLSVSTHAANHHEVRLVQLCFDFYMIEAKPENLIGDRAYDSDPLDEQLRRDGIEMIAPHRSNRAYCARGGGGGQHDAGGRRIGRVLSRRVQDDFGIGAHPWRQALRRSISGVEPTHYGRALLKSGVDEMRKGLQQIEFIKQPDAGDLRVCSSILVDAGLLPAVIERFSQDFPRASLHVLPENIATEQHDNLRQRNVELVPGRLPVTMNEPDLVAEPLFDEPNVVAAGSESCRAKRRNLTLADLMGEPWVLAQPGSASQPELNADLKNISAKN